MISPLSTGRLARWSARHPWIVMALLGNVNWYLPKWLQWLPELHLEGVPAVARVRETETRRL